MRRWAAIGSAALLSMGAGALASRAAADPLARVIARAFGAVAATLPSPAALPAPQSDVPLLPAEPLEDATHDPSPGTGQKPTRVSAARREPPRKGILVRRATVRAAVRAGVRPSAAPVGDSPDHPAGLQVYGLGASGGLRDGDIVTRVGGMTPRSIEDVIAAVAGCYKNKTYSISGEFWRDGERWNAVVELPEPKRDRSEEASDTGNRGQLPKEPSR